MDIGLEEEPRLQRKQQRPGGGSSWGCLRTRGQGGRVAGMAEGPGWGGSGDRAGQGQVELGATVRLAFLLKTVCHWTSEGPTSLLFRD